MIELSDEQQTLFERIVDFVEDPRPAKQTFCFTGEAGVGKSVVLAHVAKRYHGAKLACFTGKAASVLSRKSGMMASTLHSLLYDPPWEDEHGELQFEGKIVRGEWTRGLALIDEISCVSDGLMRDLLDTGIRVVTAGDSGQLPPVNGKAWFEPAVVDGNLTEIHRQAWDSAIIRQAHSVRSGKGYCADGDDFRVERVVSHEDIVGADIVLCWRNATREALNNLVRAHRGLDVGEACEGEPVMGLRNDRRMGIFNGGIYYLVGRHRAGDGYLALENERGEEVEVPGWIDAFEAPRGWEQGSAAFAWGYAATVHKYQGSQADKVILVDEYNRAEDGDRWRYTAISRAAQSIVVQRG